LHSANHFPDGVVRLHYHVKGVSVPQLIA